MADPFGKTDGSSPSSICHLHQHPRNAGSIALLAEDLFNDCNRVSEDSSYYGSSISDDAAETLTPSQVDRICHNVDTALTIPTFPLGFRLAQAPVPAPAPAPAPEPAQVEAASSSIQIDLSRLSVVILFLHADGSPKGLSFTPDDDHIRKVGDCRAEPGCVRVWYTPDLKYLAYTAFNQVSFATRPPNPGYIRVWDIWFLEHVDDGQAAFPMTGTMTFRFPSSGLGIDLRFPHYTGEQGHIPISYPLAGNTRYRYDVVAPDDAKDIGDSNTQKKESRCRRIAQRFVKERRRQKTNAKRAGSAIKRIIKRSSPND